jgi:hypothetical protein
MPPPNSLRKRVGSQSPIFPVSLRAGVLGDGWLPLTAQAMAFQLQKGTSREDSYLLAWDYTLKAIGVSPRYLNLGRMDVAMPCFLSSP